MSKTLNCVNVIELQFTKDNFRGSVELITENSLLGEWNNFFIDTDVGLEMLIAKKNNYPPINK